MQPLSNNEKYKSSFIFVVLIQPAKPFTSRLPYGAFAVHEHVQIDLWNPRGAEHALVLRHADRHGVPDQQWSHLFAVQVAFEKHRLMHDRSGPKRRHFQEIFNVAMRGIL